ncbi:MAG: CbrC family protein [Verrucomicrobiota bacterium]
MKTEFEFTYFADPKNFAYMHEGTPKCNFCGQEKECLDGDHFFGEEKIEAICFKCMKEGMLEELDISGNDCYVGALSGTEEENKRTSREITYCTPKLPTWQDAEWPIKNGKAYKFLKIASKTDYIRNDNESEGKAMFIQSLHDNENDDFDWLWSMLPDQPVTNMKEGQYDLSFYLFTLNGELLTIWDCN